MTLEIKKYNRKSFAVEAIQVTPENMAEVAKWCDGEIKTDGEKEGNLSRDHIKVEVSNPLREKQTKAFLGDWVLKSGKKSFKVYTNNAFYKSFYAVTD